MSAALQMAALLAALAEAPVAVPAEQEAAGMLPPEIAQQVSPHYLAGFGEPALWSPQAGRGYRTRMRLTMAGVVIAKVSIRIDERETGELEGHMVYLQNGNRTETSFRVSPAQMEQLQLAIGRAGLWTIHPQYWVLTDANAICIDGMEMIFERVDAGGYRFANANAQCTASAAMHEVAASLFEIAGAGHLRRLLR